MLKILSKIFGGSKAEKDVKELSPYAELINSEYATIRNLSESELKAKTDYFKKIIRDSSDELETEKSEIEARLKNEALDAKQTLDFHDRLKEIEGELFETIHDTLTEIMPEAYAVVKAVCQKLTDKGYTYEYAGHKTKWEMVPYDVQLMGAVVIHQGRIAEMATGEGKTLVSIMPMYLNALAEKGVHLVTVNDYLAKRDCEWMKPVFDYLGIKVGALQPKMDNEERKKIYNLDITYGTNNEFGFDYLRDNMVTEIEHKVQREHWYSIVDEIDSVLVDEARTPLIISGPVGKTDQKFDEMNPRIKKLLQVQSTLVNKFCSDAEDLLNKAKNLNGKELKETNEKAGVNLLLAHRGLPKHRKLQKLMQTPENKKLLKDTELFYLQDKGRKMKEIDEQLYYIIEEKNHVADIAEMGINLITTSQDDPDMFLIPDISTEMQKIDAMDGLSEEEKAQKQDYVNVLFAERSDRIHTTQQLLKAHSLYERDVDYVLIDGKVQIVDENTGRVLDGRRYSDGLHQAIEAKENVKVERDSQTLATITLQNYYRMYHKLSGMTGTAETEAAEFDKIYNLDVVVVPTNKPIVRDDMNDLIYKTKREKYRAIIEQSKQEIKSGRSVLIGTASVEVSEILSKMFKREKIKHELLNAKQHEREADIVAAAGKRNSITIATNMAGRGTDIKLDPEVKNSGGLTILGSERHESRRIDRQLRGRAGRQGDPGSSRFYISMEDDLMRLFGGDKSASIMSRLNIPEGEPIEANMITKAVERAQKKIEENHFSVRKRLIDYDDVMNQQRSVIYTRRNHALKGQRLKGEIFDYIEDIAANIFQEHGVGTEDVYIDELKTELRTFLLSVPNISDEDFKSINENNFIEAVIKSCDEFYIRKEELVGADFMKQLEKVAVLQTIDEKWREHLRVMDDLKEGIHLRSYGQKDPLLEYKTEAFRVFVDLIKDVNKHSVNFAFKYWPQLTKEQIKSQAPQLKSSTPSNSSMRFERTDSMADGGAREQRENTGRRGVPKARGPEGKDATTVKTIRRDKSKMNRNTIVKVRYSNGEEKETKFKRVERDIESGTATLIN